MAKISGKEKRLRKKERIQAQKEEKLRLEAFMRQRAAARKRNMILILVVGLSLAATAYWGFDNPQLTGIALLLGALVLLGYALGAVGSSVTPRDKGSAGSIDFGQR